jgi:hypothetical protein
MMSKEWIIGIAIGLSAQSCARPKQESAPQLMRIYATAIAGSSAQHIEFADDGYGTVALGAAGFETWSVSVPGHPVTLARYKSGSEISRFRRFGGVGFGVDRSARLQKFDLSELTQPREIRSYSLRQLSEVVRDVVYLEGRDKPVILVGGQFQGLAAYGEREGELVPQTLQLAEPFGRVHQIDRHGDLLIVSDYQRSIKILEIKDWPNLRTVGQISLNSPVASFKVLDDKLWIAALGEGILVVDISNVEAPQLIGQMQLPGLVREVLPLGSQVVAAYDNLSGDQSLALLDARDLQSMTVLESLRTSGAVRSLVRKDGFVYAADDAAGVLILQVHGME